MRLHNWQSRLTTTLMAAAGRPFAWGGHDCFTHAGKVAEALTGTDPTAPLHGRYHDYPSALRAGREAFGAVGMRGFGDGLWNRVPAHLARRGDWALVRRPDGTQGWALMIVDHGLLRDAQGRTLPLSAARLCWRVE